MGPSVLAWQGDKNLMVQKPMPLRKRAVASHEHRFGLIPQSIYQGKVTTQTLLCFDQRNTPLNVLCDQPEANRLLRLNQNHKHPCQASAGQQPGPPDHFLSFETSLQSLSRRPKAASVSWRHQSNLFFSSLAAEACRAR